MCYTATDSILAYIINFISSIILFKNAKNNTNKIIALFLLFVGQMQILDFMFWLNTSCNLTNKIITRIAIIFNNLQPLILFFLIRYYYKKNIKHNSTLKLLSNIVIILYLITALLYTINIWQPLNCHVITPVCCSLPHKPYNNTQVIDWAWNKRPYYYIVYSLFVLSLVLSSIQLKHNNIIVALVVTLTLLISSKIPNHSKSIGRLWCYMASLTPLLFLILDYLNINIQLNIINM